jgi:hypothetical protein
VEIFYRWHALYGRRLRRAYSERRATGELVHVEVSHSVVVAVAGWMLDAAVRSAFALGPPRASATTLSELHRVLFEHGYRRSDVEATVQGIPYPLYGELFAAHVAAYEKRFSGG